MVSVIRRYFEQEKLFSGAEYLLNNKRNKNKVVFETLTISFDFDRLLPQETAISWLHVDSSKTSWKVFALQNWNFYLSFYRKILTNYFYANFILSNKIALWLMWWSNIYRCFNKALEKLYKLLYFCQFTYLFTFGVRGWRRSGSTSNKKQLKIVLMQGSYCLRFSKISILFWVIFSYLSRRKNIVFCCYFSCDLFR